ncbi:hypothetical protein NL676_038592 [Syzygium grande]|nr:hypothetical protein NL676_038592 [Syzygium grande]
MGGEGALALGAARSLPRPPPPRAPAPRGPRCAAGAMPGAARPAFARCGLAFVGRGDGSDQRPPPAVVRAPFRAPSLLL